MCSCMSSQIRANITKDDTGKNRTAGNDGRKGCDRFKAAKKWQSDGARSGKLGGWPKISHMSIFFVPFLNLKICWNFIFFLYLIFL